MEHVMEIILRALPEQSGDDVKGLMDLLQNLGVEKMEDLGVVGEEDLVPPLTKIKARKLIMEFGGQATGSSGARSKEETTGHPQQRQRDDNDFKALIDRDDYQPVPTKDKPCYRMLLLGKTGEGKSATGNSIIGRKAFTSKADTKSVTSTVSQAYYDRGDCLIKIIDGPGTGDTRLDKTKAIEKAIKDLAKAMDKCSGGFHAMVMVFKFGNRYTQEDQDSIDFLKTLLGEDVFKKYGICVISCGDQFRGSMEDEGTPGMTIAEWCKQQDLKSDADEKVKFSSLLNECCNRVILFNNRTKNEREQFEQIEELVKTVRSLPTEGKLYTNDTFDAMDKTRQKFIIESNLPQMEESIQQGCNLIQDALKDIDLTQPNAGVKVNDSKMKAQELIFEIIVKDKDTGVLMPLKDRIDMVMRSIYDFEENQKKQKELEQKNLDAEERRKLQAEHDERNRKIQKDLEENNAKLQQQILENEKSKIKAEYDERLRNVLVDSYESKLKAQQELLDQQQDMLKMQNERTLHERLKANCRLM